MVEPPQFVLESVRKDEELILYRGKPSNQPGSPSVLLLTPVSTRPALATLKKIEHEYSLRDELDSVWAVRPLGLSQQRGQTTKLEAIKSAGAKVEEITLAPLAREHLEQLIADAVRCEPEPAVPLAQLVHDKTAGNPFFVIRFLYALAEEGLLTFDHEAARWSWDLDLIHAKGYIDNVVDLIVGKLTRLPAETQTVCTRSGNNAEA